MSEARRFQLSRARDVGPGAEMTPVRKQVREVLAANPDDPKLLLWASRVLAQAASAEKRLAPPGSAELAENLRMVLDNFQEQLRGPDADGTEEEREEE
jgi:hypothetical protein